MGWSLFIRVHLDTILWCHPVSSNQEKEMKEERIGTNLGLLYVGGLECLLIDY